MKCENCPAYYYSNAEGDIDCGCYLHIDELKDMEHRQIEDGCNVPKKQIEKFYQLSQDIDCGQYKYIVDFKCGEFIEREPTEQEKTVDEKLRQDYWDMYEKIKIGGKK